MSYQGWSTIINITEDSSGQNLHILGNLLKPGIASVVRASWLGLPSSTSFNCFLTKLVFLPTEEVNQPMPFMHHSGQWAKHGWTWPTIEWYCTMTTTADMANTHEWSLAPAGWTQSTTIQIVKLTNLILDSTLNAKMHQDWAGHRLPICEPDPLNQVGSIQPQTD